MDQSQDTRSQRSGVVVKLTFSALFTLATLSVVCVLLYGFVSRVFDSNKEEVYNYLMHTGIVACAISVIKFNILSITGKSLQITGIKSGDKRKRRRSAGSGQEDGGGDDDNGAPPKDVPSTPLPSQECGTPTFVKPQEPGPSRSRPHLEPGPSRSRPHLEPGPSTSRPHQEPGPSTSRTQQEPEPSTSRAFQKSVPSTERTHSSESGSSTDTAPESVPCISEDESDVEQQSMQTTSGDSSRSPVVTRGQTQRRTSAQYYSYSKGKGTGKGLRRHK